jgi:DNA-binding FadR family transcriptional regulator
MRQLEPACAASCALRPDRETTILPRLRKNVDDSRTLIDDADRYIGLARQFHIELVAGCGNETMSLIVGALEALWSAHVETLARKTARHGSFADREVRLTTLKEHEKIYRLIAKGDSVGAERAAREHFSEADHQDQGWHHEFDLDAIVKASALRDG